VAKVWSGFTLVPICHASLPVFNMVRYRYRSYCNINELKCSPSRNCAWKFCVMKKNFDHLFKIVRFVMPRYIRSGNRLEWWIELQKCNIYWNSTSNSKSLTHQLVRTQNIESTIEQNEKKRLMGTSNDLFQNYLLECLWRTKLENYKRCALLVQ